MLLFREFYNFKPANYLDEMLDTSSSVKAAVILYINGYIFTYLYEWVQIYTIAHTNFTLNYSKNYII